MLYKNLASAKCYVNDKLTTVKVDGNNTAELSGSKGTTYVFDFDGTYVGINNATIDAEGNAKSDVLYNVNGQRVNKSYRGIVVSNGRKMIQK